jgi:hypothetical protein
MLISNYRLMHLICTTVLPLVACNLADDATRNGADRAAAVDELQRAAGAPVALEG